VSSFWRPVLRLAPRPCARRPIASSEPARAGARGAQTKGGGADSPDSSIDFSIWLLSLVERVPGGVARSNGAKLRGPFRTHAANCVTSGAGRGSRRRASAFRVAVARSNGAKLRGPFALTRRTASPRAPVEVRVDARARSGWRRPLEWSQASRTLSHSRGELRHLGAGRGRRSRFASTRERVPGGVARSNGASFADLFALTRRTASPRAPVQGG